MTMKGSSKFRLNIGRALRSPPIRAKALGLFFIAVGLYLILINKDPEYQEIGFGTVFIGSFIFLVITERTIPKKLSDAYIASNMELINSLVDSLHLKGNGIYIPTSNDLLKERVLIPAQENENIDLPVIKGNSFFIPKTSESGLSVVFVPPGLELLDTIEKEMGIKFENIDIDKLGQYLQIMIYGLGLLKSLSIELEDEKFIRVKIKHVAYDDIYTDIVKKMGNLYRQTGCPICSSILCAITRSSGKEVRIQNADIEDNEIIYLLRIGG
jgi:hypothetical protein